ncbi:MAG: DNA-directed RNA polymerase subunit P [Candidatus Diapherotrites archaeon]|nr:DNA-directed RNA polymerase subunit P [Candidatus Diapherotrites archaeon]
MYVCGTCKKIIDDLPAGSTKCKFCGGRILFKQRPPVVKSLKAK